MYSKDFTLDCLFKKEEVDFEYNHNYHQYPNQYDQYDYLKQWYYLHPDVKKEGMLRYVI